jgi:cell wall-associated NlpC family hydrolase
MRNGKEMERSPVIPTKYGRRAETVACQYPVEVMNSVCNLVQRVMRRSRSSSRSKVFLGATLAVAIGVTVVAFPTDTATATGSDSKRREVEALADELERLTDRMDALAENYVEAIALQEELGVEVQQARDELAETEQDISAMRGTLYQAALSRFMNGGRNSTLTNLLTTTGSVQDALQREEMTSIALNTGAMTTDQLDALAYKLTKQRQALEKKEAEAEKLAETVLSRQSDVELLAAQYEARRNSAQGELLDLLRAEQSRRESVAFEESKRIANQYQSTQQKYSNLPKVSARAQTAVSVALKQLGTPYKYATSVPGVGFDCSGLTTHAWGAAGVGLPRNSRAQYYALPRIPKEAAQPGDLIFTGNPIHHVGLYLGGGRMVHAPQTGDVVKISPVSWYKVVGVGRPR